MEIKAFIYHKRAEKYCDCQDCFGIDTQNNRIAMSDGMSQSIFPQWWAKLLVDAFIEKGIIPYANNDILPLQIEWQEKVKAEIIKQESDGKNPWLLKDVFADRSGAGATLCGFEWDKNTWTCQCLGDTSLIKIKFDNSFEIFSSQKGEFDNRPDYLDSFSTGRGNPLTTQGDFNLKAILIVSDPFAELFQIHQNDISFISKRVNEILGLYNHESFVNLIEYWRDTYNLHNDDSTLIALDNFHSKKTKIIWKDSLVDLCKKEESADESDTNSTESIDGGNGIKAAEAEFRNSTKNLLKYYPSGRTKSKSKILPWIKDKYISIVESFIMK